MNERNAEDITWTLNCKSKPGDNSKFVNMALGIILSHRQRRSISSTKKSERSEETISVKPFGGDGPAKIVRTTYKDCLLDYTDELSLWKLEVFLCWDTYPNGTNRQRESERPTRFEVVVTEPETDPNELVSPFEDDDDDSEKWKNG